MRLLFPMVILLITIPILCTPSTLPPVDEAISDESLLAFRSYLLEIVHTRDADKLLEVVSPDIVLSFGGQAGLDDFHDMWSPFSENSKLWPILEFTLSHGGSLTKQGDIFLFWAPYYFSEFPDDLDPFEHAIVIDSSVLLYDKPDYSSKVLATLNYTIVRVTEFAASEKHSPVRWVKVQIPDGPMGYVRANLIISPIDYRICLAKKDGKWLITVLVSGD